MIWTSLNSGSWASVALVAAVVIGTMAVIHVALRAWVLRKAREDDRQASTSADPAGVRGWVARGFRLLLPPLALLIWIQGIAFVLRLVLAAVPPDPWIEYGRLALVWAYSLAVVAALVWLLRRAGELIEAFLVSLAGRAETSWDDLLLPLAGKAVRLSLPLLALILGAPALSLSPPLAEMVRNLTSLLLIGVVSMILMQIVNAVAAFVLRQHRLDVTDNLQARAVHTQVIVLKKVALTVIGVFTLASMLMVFESVRQFGASILASAGVAGIVIGFAAQRSIATLLAGFQIALTQPIRVDDVVIVENEWGRVEDITLTYVVVRIWDLRRLVLPITYFIEQPFQNWTRSSADILGTVFLHVDYTMPLEPLRAELTRILEASPRWDRKVNVLQVTDAKEQTLEVRALASARDASQAWDLRCEVREGLIAFIQRNYPESLPRVRASFTSMAGSGPAETRAPLPLLAS